MDVDSAVEASEQDKARGRIRAELQRRAEAAAKEEAEQAAKREAARLARIRAREEREASWRRGKAAWEGTREPLDPPLSAALLEGAAADGSGGHVYPRRPSPAVPSAAMEIVSEAQMPELTLVGGGR